MPKVGKTAKIILCVVLLFGFRPFKSPSFQKVKTKNGIEVIYFKAKKTPLFEISMYYNYGSTQDPVGKSGLAELAINLFDRGAKGNSENVLSEKFDSIAGGHDFAVSQDYAILRFWGLNSDLESALDLIFLLLKDSRINSAVFSRIKKNHLESVNRVKEHPQSLASHVFNMVLFNNSIRARPTYGLREDLKKIQPKDLKNFQKEMFRTDRLRVLVVGGSDRHEVLDPFLRRLEELPLPRKKTIDREPEAYIIDSAHLKNGSLLIVNRPKLLETHIRLGFIGPSRRVPELHELQIAETVLGGSYGSRLNQILREKLNLTYSIDAGFYYSKDDSVFLVSSSTHVEKFAKFYIELKKELKRFVEDGISEDELKDAKSYLTGSFFIGLENIYSVANMLFKNLLYGIKSGFLEEYRERITKITVDDVHRAIQKYYKLDEIKAVVVSDAKALSKELKKAGIGFTERKADRFL
ncbi:MAG: M16 family metallopeptidase [Bacteriovoracia bacterium]